MYNLHVLSNSIFGLLLDAIALCSLIRNCVCASVFCVFVCVYVFVLYVCMDIFCICVSG